MSGELEPGVPTTPGLTHLDERGRARMVDVTSKVPTDRQARARCRLVLAAGLAARARRGELWSAETLGMAKAAGMLAAKSTPALVPLCHEILLDEVRLDLYPSEDGLEVVASVTAHDRTGVEIEALTACVVTALTLYERVKGDDPGARVEGAVVLEKAGGRSGTWRRREDGSVEHHVPADRPVADRALGR